MYVKISMTGTEMLFDCRRITEHVIDDEPDTFLIVIERDGLEDFEIKSSKDLNIYIMNDAGKTIDRKFYRQ